MIMHHQIFPSFDLYSYEGDFDFDALIFTFRIQFKMMIHYHISHLYR